MAAPTVEDLIQTFANGINRPEAAEEDYLPFAQARNFVYARTSGTTAQRPIGVPTGWTYYDTTEEEFVGWDGSAWISLAAGGGGLSAPESPGDDGKFAIASGGDIVWTAGSSLTVGVATYANGLRETSGPTTLTVGAVADGNLLQRSGTSFIGVSAAGLTVNHASTATSATSASLATVAAGLRFNATDLACSSTAPSAQQLLYRNGSSQIAGINASSLTVGSSQGLFFAANRATSASNPNAHDLIFHNASNQIAGIAPGDVMSRRTASNSSAAALTFTANALRTWNGSATPSFTVDSTGAVDGATIIIYFPASSITSITFDTDFDPTGTLAYAFDSASAAYELVVQWRAQGYVVASFRKVQLA